YAIVGDIIPTQRTDLVEPLRGQQQRTHETAKDAALGRRPYGPDLVVVENALALLGFRVGAPHAAHNRCRIVVIARGIPVGDGADDGQAHISLSGAMLVLDMIEHAGHVAPLDALELTFGPSRQDIFSEAALNLVGRAQSLGLDVPFDPIAGDGLEAVGLDRWRLDRWHAGLDALDGIASEVSSALDLHHVGG